MGAGREPGDDDADKRDLEELDNALKDAGEESEDKPEPRARREEPEDDDDDPEAYLVEEERQPRRERRSSRYDDLQREARAEREQRIRLEAQIAAMQRPQQAAPSIEEFEGQVMEQMHGLQKDRLRLAQYVQTRGDQLTEEERDDVMRREAGIQLRQQELGFALAQRRQQAAAPPPQDPGLAYLKSRYSDVVTDSLGVAEATAFYQRELRNGHADGLDLVEKAYKHARASLRGEPVHRRGERPRPTVESRSRYTGQSASGSGGAAPPARSVTITKAEADVAKELYKYEKDPQKRLQRYVSEVKGPTDREAATTRRRA